MPARDTHALDKKEIALLAHFFEEHFGETFVHLPLEHKDKGHNLFITDNSTSALCFHVDVRLGVTIEKGKQVNKKIVTIYSKSFSHALKKMPQFLKDSYQVFSSAISEISSIFLPINRGSRTYAYQTAKDFRYSLYSGFIDQLQMDNNNQLCGFTLSAMDNKNVSVFISEVGITLNTKLVRRDQVASHLLYHLVQMIELKDPELASYLPSYHDDFSLMRQEAESLMALREMVEI